MKNVFFCVLLVLASCVFSLGQTYKVLYSFGTNDGYFDGNTPASSLISDAAGNLYGTTLGGGTGSFYPDGPGIVFELSPQIDGTWVETVLYIFCSVNTQQHACEDGAEPAAGLAFDAQGNLYGTAYEGGAKDCGRLSGCGVVFELSPPSAPGSPWTENVIYNFCSVKGALQVCLDGEYPWSQLVFDAAGNLYGTTSEGGSGTEPEGTVFELSHGSNGWTETILYNFCSTGSGTYCPDGAIPYAGVTFDKAGNLYGTTQKSDAIVAGEGGVLFKLSPTGIGWQESVLLFTKQYRLYGPYATVSSDPQGNLYTTAAGGGKNGGGGVLRLDAATGKVFTWSLSPSTDYGPMAGVLVDPTRKVLYGTSADLGGSGSVFQITSQGTLSNLYEFCSLANCADGGEPRGGLIEDSQGNLYGTASDGGTFGQGVVFELTP